MAVMPRQIYFYLVCLITLVMIIIVYLWKHMGYVALIYLAGLQAIPQDLRDAAAIDGAGKGTLTAA